MKNIGNVHYLFASKLFKNCRYGQPNKTLLKINVKKMEFCPAYQFNFKEFYF